MSGPSPHLTSDLIARWRSRALTAAELLAASDHLEGCADCRDALASGRDAAVVARSVQRQLEREELTHLDGEQLQRWVDGAADSVESEIVESHLAVCDRCGAEVEDLRRFAATLRSPAARWPRERWLTAAAAAVVALGIAFYALRRPTPPPARDGQPRPSTAATSAAVPSPATVLRDGALTIAVRSDGAVEGVPAHWHDLVAAALRQPELALPGVAVAVARAAEVQRDETEQGEPEVRLRHPLSRVVLETRPTFRWTGRRDTGYEVAVYDPRFELVATSGELRGTSWTPSEPLPRGELFTWKVTVRRDGEETSYPRAPTPPAVFQVVAEEAAAEVEAARATGSHLVAGLALWRAGAIDEAAAELALLQQQNPTSRLAAALAAASRRGTATARSER